MSANDKLRAAIVADSVLTSFSSVYDAGYKQAKEDLRPMLQELYHALSDALEIADDYADVDDQVDEAGKLRPNRAMTMAQELKPLVERARNYLKEHA